MPGSDKWATKGGKRAATLCACVAGIIAIGLLTHGLVREWTDASELRVVTWNIAAINNNPFEYWLTHPDSCLFLH